MKQYTFTLPIKLGLSTYSVLDWDSIYIEKAIITMLQQKANGCWKFRATNTVTKSSSDYYLDDIGKRIFLTKEEAETYANQLSIQFNKQICIEYKE